LDTTVTGPKSTTPAHDDQWRIPDALWCRIEPLLPPRPPHPLGCHNPRVADRKAMDAIFFVLRTGCQWGALDATGICSHSAAHRRFQEWAAAGVFVNLWATGLQEYDALKGLDWEWLAMDGAMTKAPLGGERTGRNPTDRGKLGTKRSLLTEANGIPVGLAVEGANRHDKKVAEATLESIPVEPGTTRRWPRRPWRASRWSGPSRRRIARRGCAWTRGTTTTTRGSWCGSSASPPMSGPGARRPGR
jgi:putative transposase